MKRKIIHKISDRVDKVMGRRYYLCNQAVRPKSVSKYSFKWENVNCKNCLKQKEIGGMK